MGAGRIKIVFALFSFGLLAASLMASVYFYKYVKKDEEVLLEIEALKFEPPPLPDPGADRFNEARELLGDGELDAARNKLSYILKFYEDSERYDDAKRVIGEMNVDQLLSSEPMNGKIDYTVRSGDSLAAIATRNRSTVSFIMRANSMIDTRIHPGDRLLVAPLEFTVVLNVAEKTLTLTREDRFFKEYPIRRLKLPYGAKPPFSTRVTDKVASLGEKRVPLADERVQSTEKWLHTKVPGLVLGTYETPAGGSPSDSAVGISLDEADLEELFTLLRVSTPIKVVG